MSVRSEQEEENQFLITDVTNKTFQLLKNIKYTCPIPVQIQNGDLNNFCVGINNENNILIYNLSTNTIKTQQFSLKDQQYKIETVFYDQELKILLQNELNQFFLADQANITQLDIQGNFIYQIQDLLFFYSKQSETQIKIIALNTKRSEKYEFIKEISPDIQTKPNVLYNRKQNLINILFNSNESGFTSITFLRSENKLKEIEDPEVNQNEFQKFLLSDDFYADFYKQIDFTSSSFRFPSFSSKIQIQNIQVDKQIIQTEEGIDQKSYFKEVQDDNSKLSDFCTNGFRYYQILYGFNAFEDYQSENDDLSENQSDRSDKEEVSDSESEGEGQQPLFVIVASNKYQIRPDLVNGQMFMYSGENIYDMADFGPQTDVLMTYQSKDQESGDNSDDNGNNVEISDINDDIEGDIKKNSEEEQVKNNKVDKQQMMKKQQIVNSQQEYKINKQVYDNIMNKKQTKLENNNEEQMKKLLQTINQQDVSSSIELLLNNKSFKQYIEQHNLQQNIKQLQNLFQKQQEKAEIKEKQQEKTKLDFGETKVVELNINQLQFE